MEATLRIAPERAFDHGGGDGAAKLRQRAAVEIDHLPLARGIQLHKRSAQAESRIVDEDVDLLARLFEVAHERGGRARPGQVDFDRPCIAELRRERIEAVLAARRKDQPMTFGGKLPRELDAQACRGARDQRDAGHVRPPA